MKAIIKFYNQYGDRKQATVEVEENEPNSIIRKAIEQKKIQKHEIIRTIRCGKYEYQWFDIASNACPQG